MARALKAEGVEAIFTLCGGHIIDIYDGCLDEGIKIIDVRHEQAAAHATNAWTRVTGKPSRDSSPLLWVDEKAAGAEGLSGEDHKGERYG